MSEDGRTIGHEDINLQKLVQLSEQRPFAKRSNVEREKQFHGTQKESSLAFGGSIKMCKCDAESQRGLENRQASDGFELQLFVLELSEIRLHLKPL